jgi:hypothetical protein
MVFDEWVGGWVDEFAEIVGLAGALLGQGGMEAVLCLCLT